MANVRRMAKVALLWSLFFILFGFSSTRVIKDPPCLKDAYPPNNSTRIRDYVINLDLPPEHRWDQVLKDHTDNVQRLLATFKQFLFGLGPIGHKVWNVVDKYGPKLLDNLPKEYVLELKGIASRTNIPLGEVVLNNVFYEFFSVCTSIVARDGKGHLYHARNMDFGLLMGWNDSAHTWSVSHALRPLIINVIFQKHERTIYKAVTFAGFIGVYTAVKPNNFTFTINERFELKGGWLGLIQWVMGDHNQQWLNILTRQLMENVHSFEEAKHKLSTDVLIAPAYFILGGLGRNEGCVVTRARREVLQTRCLNDTTWFVIQTNYDYWKPPFFLDDRRTPALRCMDALTSQNVKLPHLFNVLATKPMMNKLTVYTSLMRVYDGHLESWRQDCPDPCPPW